MYAPPEDVGRIWRRSPTAETFLLCEYMHNMGIPWAYGELIRLRRSSPVSGAFIWDYMDQALWHTDCMGGFLVRRRFRRPAERLRIQWQGIVFADDGKASMQEVRYWYASPEERAAHDAANRALLPSPCAGKVLPPPDGARRRRAGRPGKDFEILFSYPKATGLSVSGAGSGCGARPARLLARPYGKRSGE